MYHMFLGKSLIDIAACLCVYMHVCVCICMCGKGRSSTSLIALYVNLKEAVAHVRIT